MQNCCKIFLSFISVDLFHFTCQGTKFCGEKLVFKFLILTFNLQTLLVLWTCTRRVTYVRDVTVATVWPYHFNYLEIFKTYESKHTGHEIRFLLFTTFIGNLFPPKMLSELRSRQAQKRKTNFHAECTLSLIFWMRIRMQQQFLYFQLAQR
jgi:hypothetical protein